MVLRNTLVDSSGGDYDAINMPIGQTTPFPGSFTTLTASTAIISGTISASNLAISGTVAVSNVNVSSTVSAANIVASQGAFAGTVTVGGLGILYQVNPSINLTTLTSGSVGAVALTAAINVIISVSYTSGGPVILPSVATWLGGEISVFNQSSHSVMVWPQALDIIDSTATGAGVIMNSNVRAGFIAVSTTGIISYQYGTTAV